jgi:hypothetical protein
VTPQQRAEAGRPERLNLLGENIGAVEECYARACRPGGPETAVLVLDVRDPVARDIAAYYEGAERVASKLADAEGGGGVAVFTIALPLDVVREGLRPTHPRCGEGLSLPIPDGTFRVVVIGRSGTTYAAHPVPEGERMREGAAAAMKEPAGVFLGSIPDRWRHLERHLERPPGAPVLYVLRGDPPDWERVGTRVEMEGQAGGERGKDLLARSFRAAIRTIRPIACALLMETTDDRRVVVSFESPAYNAVAFFDLGPDGSLSESRRVEGRAGGRFANLMGGEAAAGNAGLAVLFGRRDMRNVEVVAAVRGAGLSVPDEAMARLKRNHGTSRWTTLVNGGDGAGGQFAALADKAGKVLYASAGADGAARLTVYPTLKSATRAHPAFGADMQKIRDGMDTGRGGGPFRN